MATFDDNPTWFQARDAAANMTYNGWAGHLATFTTKDEQEAVIGLLGGGWYINALWLGGYQDVNDPNYTEPYGGWKWITGEQWLGVAQNSPPLPRADAGFNNTYFNYSSEEHLITWWNSGGINDYYHSPASNLGDANGGPARGFIVEYEAPPVIQVLIDIHPGSTTNPVNPYSMGDTPVAILSTSVADGDAFDFDATTVDPSTVEFGPSGATIAHTGGHIEDVDSDGDMDLMLHFSTQATGIACGHTAAILRGQTYGSDDIEGVDVLVTVGCP
ncbi:MAG: hypothetical protein C0600_10085 [Ignavibacteria bacterium]|nr:MAG: hypothetical protein C0600_10085 [Ignavibacteria bacterium]